MAKQLMSFRLDNKIADRLRNAAYWSPGQTMSAIVEAAVIEKLARMEKAQGAAFKPRKAELTRGRKVAA